jgi:hypothetical protein
MTARLLLQYAAVAAVSALGGWWMHSETAVAAAPRVFELRTYTAHEGKIEALHARFRNHTVKLFTKHGMQNIGYWVPQDAPGKTNTLIYIVAHASREQAQKNWEAFRNDPAWIQARDESEKNGKLVAKVESVFMDAVDYSPLK